MKKLPLSLQTFSKIISGNYVYVDKTQYIYWLVQGDCYFFARPRRFGKSVLCSTLKELFLGNKIFFEGLWITRNTDYLWPKHPVIHIDFLTIAHASPEELKASLMRCLNQIALTHNLLSLELSTPGEMLKDLVIKLLQKYGDENKVVLIIDEYDKPIIQHIEDYPTAQAMRTVLKGFYEFIKGLDEYLRFVFITGVSKFSKTSIFSGLNQLVDVTMDPRAAHLVGYTEEEISYSLSEYLEELALAEEYSTQELLVKMRTWYNGYRFWQSQTVHQFRLGGELARVYNPFSVHRLLDSKKFENYWFDSGTPTFLINLIKKNNYPIELFSKLKASLRELMTFEIEDLPLTTLLYQTGYVTIESYDEQTKNFTLAYPNLEVEDALLNNILGSLTQHKAHEINDYTEKLRNALEEANIDAFIFYLKAFYVLVPNTIHISLEKYYQTIFYVVLKLIGADIEVEISTNIGRIDAVIRTQSNLFLIEFKINKPASIALDQIKQRHYFERYLNDKRKIKLVGISFSTKEKNISDVITQDIEEAL